MNPNRLFPAALVLQFCVATFTAAPGRAADPPRLTMVRDAEGRMVISWTPSTSGFRLQESNTLLSSMWTDTPREAANPFVVPLATASVKSFRLIKTGDVPTGFATIPAGTFTMGSPEDELGRGWDESPQHTVTLTRTFFLQRTEVTWTQWNTVRVWALTHGYTDLPVGRNGLTGDASGTHPVTEVNWYDAVKWLNAWSEKEKLTPCYTFSLAVMRTGTDTPTCDVSASGFRLPTESEWEYACRAGTTTAFYNGGITHPDTSPLDKVLDASGWYGGNSGSNTHPVGQKEVNAFGLYDMHGNVWEWCGDWFGTYPTGSVTDSQGFATGSFRVLRGGDWGNVAQFCRSANRSFYSLDSRVNNNGFRPAISSGF